MHHDSEYCMEESLDAEKGLKKNQHNDTFVDYVAPEKSIPPPAKYKLGFLIFTGVYFSLWFQSEAGFVPWLIRTFRVAPTFALFFFLWIAVGCLSYGYLDVLSFFIRVKINGEWYGITSWLKQPRIQWVHEYENVFVDCIRSIVVILEDGFTIFNKPPLPKPVEEPSSFDNNSNEPVLLRIENHIQKDKIVQYEKLRDQLKEAMNMKNNPAVLKVDTEGDEDGLRVVIVLFRTADDLTEFMESPVRKRMVRQIIPLLVTPSKVQLLKDRSLPDAFTDLLNQQGQPVPDRQPKKWKVWFLSTLSIYLVISFANIVLPHYLQVWGLIDVHPRLQTIVTIGINVFLNAYIMTPFVTMTFGHWLVRPKHDEPGDRREPWRTFNDGFQTIAGKLVMCVLFYGGLAIAWIV